VSFRRLLTTLVERVPKARGAVFCDHEGESVELVIEDESLSEYEMKVAGAQLAAIWIALQDSARDCGAGGLVELQVGCGAGSLLCRALPDGYYVVLLVGEGGSGASAAFALRSAATQIASEL
jgi:predicted regulator of Ras-like GTPase activity (Roadblock/LC7/MglB family)